MFGGGRAGVIGVEEFVDGPPPELFQRVAQHGLQRLVDGEDPSVEVGDADSHVRRGEDGFEPGVRGVGGAFGLLPGLEGGPVDGFLLGEQ